MKLNYLTTKEEVLDNVQSLDELIGDYKQLLIVTPEKNHAQFWAEQSNFLKPLLHHIRVSLNNDL